MHQFCFLTPRVADSMGQGRQFDYSGYGPNHSPRRDEKTHESIISDRVNREKPCRTLFIRNIKYETNSDDVRRKFEEHGDVKTFFDLISNRGMVFVTYVSDYWRFSSLH
jgi:RNA recognition motif-containing protein